MITGSSQYATEQSTTMDKKLTCPCCQIGTWMQHSSGKCKQSSNVNDESWMFPYEHISCYAVVTVKFALLPNYHLK
jgi:hypothetical protein